MRARARFLDYVLSQLEKPALWGAKGDDAFDCSGLVTCGIREAGGPDLRLTHNADKLAHETRPLLAEERPIPGDLIFFDGDSNGIAEHVGIVKDMKTAIDAEGATHLVTSVEEAKRRNARVRLHGSLAYRPRGRIHRNTYLDALDFVNQ